MTTRLHKIRNPKNIAEVCARCHDNAEIVDAVSLSKVYSDYLPAALAECANLENQQGWLQQLFCW